MSEKELPLREKILDISRHLLYNDGHTALSMREESVEALSVSIEQKVDANSGV